MVRFLVGVTIVVLPVVSMAQGTMTETQRRANAAFTAQDWKTAAELYATLARENASVAMPHFRLAVALIGLRRHNEAGAHLVTAESLGTPAAQVAFRRAQIHAARGANDSAFAQLRRATDARLAVAPVSLESDQDMLRLKSDARFEQFVKDMDRNARPCMYDARFAEFDYWLGTWDVRPNGQPNAPPARNVITKILNGCVVLESWSAPGSSGQSYNIFDRTRGQWFQKWVDAFGGLHEYAGGIKDGNMTYEGDMPAPGAPNARVRTRLTFFKQADGSVRQFSEVTQDNVATWQVNYDLIYTRKRDSASENDDSLRPGDERVSGALLRPHQRAVTQITTSFVVNDDGINGTVRLWVSREARFVFKSEEIMPEAGTADRSITMRMLS